MIENDQSGIAVEAKVRVELKTIRKLPALVGPVHASAKLGEELQILFFEKRDCKSLLPRAFVISEHLVICKMEESKYTSSRTIDNTCVSRTSRRALKGNRQDRHLVFVERQAGPISLEAELTKNPIVNNRNQSIH
jgi:hypothetical protein